MFFQSHFTCLFQDGLEEMEKADFTLEDLKEPLLCLVEGDFLRFLSLFFSMFLVVFSLLKTV